MKKNITLKDIAEKLNVSSVTVSKALNDKEGVSEELREKIKEVAESMGYRMNAAAKSMRYGYSYNIGVIIPERDRKSTRLNSSHVAISYAVFCLKKKKKNIKKNSNKKMKTR